MRHIGDSKVLPKHSVGVGVEEIAQRLSAEEDWNVNDSSGLRYGPILYGESLSRWRWERRCDLILSIDGPYEQKLRAAERTSVFGLSYRLFYLGPLPDASEAKGMLTSIC